MAYLMGHVVNNTRTHLGKLTHGSAGHNQGRDRAPKAADVRFFGALNPIEPVLVHSLELELYRRPEPGPAHTE